jgi:hypothetical protein
MNLLDRNKKNGNEMIKNLTDFNCEIICCIGITKHKEARFELVLSAVDNQEIEVINQLQKIIDQMKKRHLIYLNND